MPNWKYPCRKCFKPVKSNQKGLECNNCIKWVHFKCTNLTDTQYNFLEENNEVPYYCFICNPEWVCIIPDNLDLNPTIPSPSLPTNTDISLKSPLDSLPSENVTTDNPDPNSFTPLPPSLPIIFVISLVILI